MTAPSHLNLLKLSAGCDSLETLRAWQADRRRLHGQVFHRTRMMPRRREALLDGGSIYWVIKGLIIARQTLLEISPVVESDGGKATHLILDPALIRTVPRAQRAFQGWRYLRPEDAPRDLDAGDGAGGLAEMPEAMLAELKDLCLI